jgi:hypothetical protein
VPHLAAWGESDSLSPASPGLPEPSVIPLFIVQVRCPWTCCWEGRASAGRAGSETCVGKGWDFPGQLLPPHVHLTTSERGTHQGSPCHLHPGGCLSPSFAVCPGMEMCAFHPSNVEPHPKSDPAPWLCIGVSHWGWVGWSRC